MTVYHAIMLFDEIDMLKLLLGETEEHVNQWIVVEATSDHRGNPKELSFRKHERRLKRWLPWITYIPVDLPDTDNPWVREHFQRDAALPALEGAADGDLVLIGDVDEIPSPGVWDANPDPALALSMKLNMYAVDWEFPHPHLCCVLTTAGHCRATGSLAAISDARFHGMPVIEDAGRHLTWLGGPLRCREKLDRTCHTEMTEFEKNLIRRGRCYAEGVHHSGRFQMVPVEVDDTYPARIRERRCPENWFRPREADRAVV